MQTVKLVIAYDGTDFAGSQQQPGKRTVAGELGRVLNLFYSEKVKLTFSGRTDAGVHASGQVVSFVQPTGIPLDRLKLVLNRSLPRDIVVDSVEVLDHKFSARREAKSRTYHYWMSTGIAPVSFARYVTDGIPPVNLELFEGFKQLIVGEHDFKAFRRAGSAERSTIRTIFECDLVPVEMMTMAGNLQTFWQFRISANAFLYRMVRNLVGVLLALWQNSMNLSQLQEMLLVPTDRAYPYVVADARGLHLVKVKY